MWPMREQRKQISGLSAMFHSFGLGKRGDEPAGMQIGRSVAGGGRAFGRAHCRRKGQVGEFLPHYGLND